jgi:hypothetical protein
MKTKSKSICAGKVSNMGGRDYTAERRKLFADETVSSLFTKARALETWGRKR